MNKTNRKMNQEPLQIVPMEKWPELQAVFLGDWPRSLPGYNALDTQYRWYKDGMKHDFKVYSLFGNLSNGFVAVNNKVNNYELVIQYPKDDTDALEKALTTTKVINWDTRITFAFISYHAAAVVQKVVKDKNVVLDFIPSHTFIVEKGSPLFEGTSLPHGFTFEPLTSNDIDIIDLKWPHRYPLSPWYFQLLIDSKSGYGLYNNGDLACWIFVGECGHLTHLYTLEEFRKQGLADLMLRLISNELLKADKQVFAFCVKGNDNAFKLYNKLGFKESSKVTWMFMHK